MVRWSKEYYEVLDAFEQNAGKIAYGLRFDRVKRDDIEKNKIPSEYSFYDDGKTNEVFRIFLAGFSLGQSM